MKEFENSKGAYSYILVSTICYLGDYLFMIGLPIHLAKQSNSLFTASIYLVLISIAAILVRPIESMVSKKVRPFMLVGSVELIMAGIEIVALYIVVHSYSNVFLLFVFFILAFVYNISVPTKRYVLYKYFFSGKETQKYSILQGTMERTSFLISFIVAGFVIDRYGFEYIIAYDFITFFLLGLIFISFHFKVYKKLIKKNEAQKNKKRSLPFLSLCPYVLPLSLAAVTCSSISRLGHIIIMNKSGMSAFSSALIFSTLYAFGILVGILTKKSLFWSNPQKGYSYLFWIMSFLYSISLLVPSLKEEIFLVSIIVVSLALSVAVHTIRALTTELESIVSPNKFGVYLSITSSILGVFYYITFSRFLDDSNYFGANLIIGGSCFITALSLKALGRKNVDLD